MGTVQKGKSEPVKVYLIIVLGFVLCLVSYLRFFHKGSTTGTGAGSPTPPATTQSIAAPVAPQQRAVQELQQQEFAGGVVRDIFEPGRSAATVDARLKAPDDSQPHEMTLVLNGLVYSVNNPIAVINGQFFRRGDQVGGYKIVRIGPKEVVVRDEDREIVLKVGDYGKK
jgi:hypothetical protein